MLGGKVTVGWQAGRARLPVLLQTQGPPRRAGGSVGACSLLVFTLCPRGPGLPHTHTRCPSVSLTVPPIFVTSEQEGVSQLWAQVWGQQ